MKLKKPLPAWLKASIAVSIITVFYMLARHYPIA